MSMKHVAWIEQEGALEHGDYQTSILLENDNSYESGICWVKPRLEKWTQVT